jgi:hypothetical protein
MLQDTAFRQFAQSKLYAPGQYIDQLYAFSGASARNFTLDLYHTGAGQFQSNCTSSLHSLLPSFLTASDYETQFRTRGLLNSSFGPKFKHLPLAEDAGPINAALKAFMTVLVNSYYPNPDLLNSDKELQCWFREVRAARSIDFPAEPGEDTSTLIGILTHVAFLVSAQHRK